MKNRFYAFARLVVMPILHFLFPFKIIGKENIPAEGPALICSNHVSVIDPLFLACGLKRQIFFIAKKELFDSKFGKKLFEALELIPVDRGATDMASMRKSLSVLREGGLLGIFPQGHRYKKDDNRDVLGGASLLALKSRVPVIPVTIIGPIRPFHFIHITIHKPMDLSDITRIDAHSMALTDDRLREHIWHDGHEELRRVP